MFEYNAFHIAPWGHELVVYFTLIGATAMTFVLVSIPHLTNVSREVFAQVKGPSYIFCMVALLLSAYLLTFDLGQPQRFLNILIYHHWTSPLVWGGFLLLVFGLCLTTLLYTFFIKRNQPLSHWAALIGCVAAVGFPLYTGADLSAHQGRVLWHDSMLSVLFVSLSATSGAAVVSIIALLRGEVGNKPLFRIIWRVTNWSLMATMVMFFLLVALMSYGDAQEQQVLDIINSEFGFEFWGMALVFGILIPQLLTLPRGLRKLNMETANRITTLAAVMGLVGAYYLREVIMYAGQLPQLYY